jgi:hypothetical protein
MLSHCFTDRSHIFCIDILLHTVGYSVMSLTALDFHSCIWVCADVLTKEMLSKMGQFFVVLLKSLHWLVIF